MFDFLVINMKVCPSFILFFYRFCGFGVLYSPAESQRGKAKARKGNRTLDSSFEVYILHICIPAAAASEPRSTTLQNPIWPLCFKQTEDSWLSGLVVHALSLIKSVTQFPTKSLFERVDCVKNTLKYTPY